MRTKTVFIIIFTALITIFLMINTDAVEFNFIFLKKDISKLLVVGVCTFVGFVLGFWAGRPKTTISTYDREIDGYNAEKSKLSDEDRDYIN
jgi:putative membrane protein